MFDLEGLYFCTAGRQLELASGNLGEFQGCPPSADSTSTVWSERHEAKAGVLAYLVWVTDCWAAVTDISYSITIGIFLVGVRNSFAVVHLVSDP